MSVEMTIRFRCGEEIETVTGDYCGIEMGPSLARNFITLQTGKPQFRFVALFSIIDIECNEIPEDFVVPVEEMLSVVQMHKADFEQEIARRNTEVEWSGDVG